MEAEPPSNEREARVASIADGLAQQFGNDAISIAEAQAAGAVESAAVTWREIISYLSENIANICSENG